MPPSAALRYGRRGRGTVVQQHGRFPGRSLCFLSSLFAITFPHCLCSLPAVTHRHTHTRTHTYTHKFVPRTALTAFIREKETARAGKRARGRKRPSSHQHERPLFIVAPPCSLLPLQPKCSALTLSACIGSDTRGCREQRERREHAEKN